MHIERVASKMGLFLYYPCLYRPVHTLQNVLGLLIEVLPHSPVSTDWLSFATLEKRRLRLVASTYYGCGKKRRNTIKHYIIMRTFLIRKLPYLYLVFPFKALEVFIIFFSPLIDILINNEPITPTFPKPRRQGILSLIIRACHFLVRSLRLKRRFFWLVRRVPIATALLQRIRHHSRK